MKNEVVKKMLPLNLQFFAEDGESGSENENTEPDVSENLEPDVKTFTQDEVNSLLASTKREAKKNVLSSLGFKSEAEAKNSISMLNKLLDEDSTDNSVDNKEDENEKRALAAESKLTCLLAGVDKDSIDDVIAIANKKVTKEKDLSKVLEEMKEEKRYSSFFCEDNKGTGSDPGHSGNTDDNSDSYGKRVASMNKSSSSNGKSNFFD